MIRTTPRAAVPAAHSEVNGPTAKMIASAHRNIGAT